MDKFIVSARKYRPQNFSTVIGQSHITTTLKNAINHNQLAHAFLFCGPRGVGKTTCARILAKTINCEKRTKEGEACNKCNSCSSFDQGTSFNIHELDAASNNSVEDIRELVDQIRFAPQAGAYKVYIVDEVHMLSSNAFNAFLKTLEEPPPYAIFILATTEKHKILPTILSRCQIFDFKRITTNDTVEHLQEIIKKEKITAEKAALHVIAQKSEGCLRDALSILDKIVSFTAGKLTYSNTLEHLNILDEDYYFKMIEFLQQQKLSDAMLLFDEISQKGFEGDTFLEGFAEFIRNVMVCKDEKIASLLDVAEDFKSKYVECSTAIDLGWLMTSLNLMNESGIHYKTARNKKLHIELLLIKLAYLNQTFQLSVNDNGLQKKKITESAKAIAFKSIPSFVLSDNISNSSKNNPTHTAQLIIEKELPVKSTLPKTESTPNEAPRPKVTLGSLSKIRDNIAQQNSQTTAAIPLSLEALQTAWNQYIEKLTAAANHSSASSFKTANLLVVDDNNFQIITENNIHQKFIEGERATLISYLQQYFNNRLLKYQLILEERELTEAEITKSLNNKEHYQLLCEQFPLIKELKEKLKLDIGY